jgi:hypothetical protein
MEKKPVTQIKQPVTVNQNQPESAVKPVEEDPSDKVKMNKFVMIVYLVLIFFGVVTGFLLARGLSGQGKTGSAAVPATGEKAMGIEDTTVFKDSASGRLEKGGIDGEGTHQLVREGGPSQTVYLTSSVVDLDLFIGKEVTVWGQTMGAQKAGWLMDVGKIVE